jgi:predicted HTH transcriptional regulator
MDFQDDPVPEICDSYPLYSPEGDIMEEKVRYCCPRCGVYLDEIEPKYVTIWPEIPGVTEALEKGECQGIEFKGWRDEIRGRLPPPLKKQLTESIAAFATSNPGIIYLGIENDGTVTGVDTNISKDRFELMIADFARNRVKPSLSGVEVKFLRYRVEGEEKTVIAIAVPKGFGPVYCTKAGIPYLRDGGRKRPAEPHEVEERRSAYFKRVKQQTSHSAKT